MKAILGPRQCGKSTELFKLMKATQGKKFLLVSNHDLKELRKRQAVEFGFEDGELMVWTFGQIIRSRFRGFGNGTVFVDDAEHLISDILYMFASRLKLGAVTMTARPVILPVEGGSYEDEDTLLEREAAKKSLRRKTCGEDRMPEDKKGYWLCTRDLGHDGPCAAVQVI